MTRRLSFTPFIAVSVAAFVAFACSSDKKHAGAPDGGTDAASGGSTGSGGAGSGGQGSGGKGSGGTGTMDGGGDAGTAMTACLPNQTQVQCGEYLVKHIDACGDCHSPRLATGAPDPTKFLAGNPSFADIDPTPGKGLLPTPNLTRLATDGWTEADIKDAIQNGKKPQVAGGGGLFPIMPYQTFHNMSDHDASAIAAYIHQLTPNGAAMAAHEELPPIPLPVAPLDATTIPDTTLPSTDPHYKDALLGKYIASEAGVCMECHTERKADRISLDTAKLFAGGEQFVLGGPFGTVTSLNITPDKTGIKDWTPEQVQKLILTGIDDQGMPICPPMPAGPFGAFGGMDPGQALAIGYYLTSIPGVANGLADGGVFKMCVMPMPPTGDGGMSDAGKKDGGP